MTFDYRASPGQVQGGTTNLSLEVTTKEHEVDHKVEKLVMGLHHQRYEKVKFQMELHLGVPRTM